MPRVTYRWAATLALHHPSSNRQKLLQKKLSFLFVSEFAAGSAFVGVSAGMTGSFATGFAVSSFAFGGVCAESGVVDLRCHSESSSSISRRTIERGTTKVSRCQNFPSLEEGENIKKGRV